jgi:hypothetical protein
MIVTPHLCLRRLGAGGLLDNFARHFDDVWTTAAPVERWP